MTALPQQITVKQYISDGVSTDYIYPFYITSKFDLQVYVQAQDAAPVPSSDIQTVDTAYVVNDVGNISGGTITFQSGYIPPLGYVVTINRNIQASLDVNFATVQTFNGSNLDNALNKNMLVAQQNYSYATLRNLSYIINDYLGADDLTIQSNTQIPRLQDGYIWQGSNGGVAAVLLEQGADTSTLRSELANNAPVTNGAHLVGYYDLVNSLPTTVKAFLDNLNDYILNSLHIMPPGAMVDYGGTVVPTGWLLCDGSAVSRTTYATLFANIGVTWGAGDSSTTFNLPDFRRRVAVGSGGSGTGTLGNATGNVGGEENHTMTTSELVTHTHTATPTPASGFVTTNSPQTQDFAGAGAAYQPGQALSIAIGNQGSSTPFNVIQPSAVVTKIIKY